MNSRPPSTVPPSNALVPVRAPGGPAPGEPIPVHFRHCFGCGDEAAGGLRLEVVAGHDLSVHGRLTITSEHQGAPGLAHGGILAAAVDEAMGALSFLLMHPAVTGRLEVDFRRPVPVGVTLLIDARIVAKHGRKVYTSSIVRFEGDDGDDAAYGSAIFVQVPIEHFVTHGAEDYVRAAIDDPDRVQTRWEVNP